MKRIFCLVLCLLLALPALALPVAGVLILAALSLLSYAISCSIFEKQEP